MKLNWQQSSGARDVSIRLKRSWMKGRGQSSQFFRVWLLANLFALGIVAWALGSRVIAMMPVPEPVLSLHHIVLIDYRADVTMEEAAIIAADARSSLRDIPGIVSLEVGRQARADRDVHVHDYDWAVHIKFAQEADLDVYGSHPQHQAFLDRYRDRWERIQVIDFYGE